MIVESDNIELKLRSMSVAGPNDALPAPIKTILLSMYQTLPSEIYLFY